MLWSNWFHIKCWVLSNIFFSDAGDSLYFPHLSIPVTNPPGLPPTTLPSTLKCAALPVKRPGAAYPLMQRILLFVCGLTRIIRRSCQSDPAVSEWPLFLLSLSSLSAPRGFRAACGCEEVGGRPSCAALTCSSSLADGSPSDYIQPHPGPELM